MSAFFVIVSQKNLFRYIEDPKHTHSITYYPLAKVSHSQMVLWPTDQYQLPLSNATCYGRDFVPLLFLRSC